MGRVYQGTAEQINGLSSKTEGPIYIEKIVEVPVDKIVEKIVLEERIKEVFVDKIVEKPVNFEVIKYVEVPVEKIVNVPFEVIKEVKVLDKELLQKEVNRLDCKLEEINDLILSSVPRDYDDSKLKEELESFKKLNKQFRLISIISILLALIGMVF